VTHGLLALVPLLCFLFVRRIGSGMFAVRFPWVDYFWCELRFSLGTINEFL